MAKTRSRGEDTVMRNPPSIITYTDGLPVKALESFASRIEALGGAFQVFSQPGEGTRIMATFPMSVLEGQHEA